MFWDSAKLFFGTRRSFRPDTGATWSKEKIFAATAFFLLSWVIVMLTVDRHQTVSTIPVSQVAQYLSTANQQMFLRLRLALALQLQRQLFIAVCDDVALRNAIAEKLGQDLQCLPDVMAQRIAHLSRFDLPSALNQTSATKRFLTLALPPTEPTALGQVIQQMRHEDPASVLGVQILGIEQLTRQPVHIQRAFLNHLRLLGRNVAAMQGNLLLWVTRPWLRSLQQSTPEFWRWHTGLFEFDADPAPASALLSQPAITEPPHPSQPTPSSSTPQAGILASLNSTSPEIEPTPQPVTAVLSHLQPSPEELELTELVLAGVMEEFSQQPETLMQVEALLQGDTLNLEHPHFAPIRILHQVETLQQQQAGPEDFASAYRQLGDWYRDNYHSLRAHAAPDQVQQKLHLGIRAYALSQTFLLPEHPAIPEILNDMGNLYWMLSRCASNPTEGTEHLQQSVTLYHQALDKTDCSQQSSIGAMLYNNLGAVYSDLAQRQDAVGYLKKSIAAYTSALQHRPAEVDPRRYAATQNNLGTAYWNLGQHQNLVENLQRAIAAYQQALRFYNPEEEPLHYAMIQNNLGTAYWNLSQCDLDVGTPDHDSSTTPEEILQLAIGAYRIALIYRTLAAVPAAHAATQNNLGTAYWHLANQPSIAMEIVPVYLEHAIAAYEAAIAATQLTDSPLNFDLAATHNNLASAYYQLATPPVAYGDQQAQHRYLDRALNEHVLALQQWQEQPDLYETALHGVTQTIRRIHESQGIQGQTRALSQLPGTLLPVVMKSL
jgi:tetratricopeptide (TPR) repeat protein